MRFSISNTLPLQYQTLKTLTMMMKKLRKLASVSVLTIALSSCASLFTTVADKAASIEVGMTKEEVTAKMGKPQYRRFDGNRDEWEYRSLLNNDDYDVVVMQFYNDRVVSMDSFREVCHHFSPSEKK